MHQPVTTCFIAAFNNGQCLALANFLLAIFADLAEYGVAVGILTQAVVVRFVLILKYASTCLIASAQVKAGAALRTLPLLFKDGAVSEHLGAHVLEHVFFDTFLTRLGLIRL